MSPRQYLLDDKYDDKYDMKINMKINMKKNVIEEYKIYFYQTFKIGIYISNESNTFFLLLCQLQILIISSKEPQRALKGNVKRSPMGHEIFHHRPNDLEWPPNDTEWLTNDSKWRLVDLNEPKGH